MVNCLSSSHLTVYTDDPFSTMDNETDLRHICLKFIDNDERFSIMDNETDLRLILSVLKMPSGKINK